MFNNPFEKAGAGVESQYEKEACPNCGEQKLVEITFETSDEPAKYVCDACGESVEAEALHQQEKKAA